MGIKFSFDELYGIRLQKSEQKPMRAGRRSRSSPCSRSGWRLTEMAGQKLISFSVETGEGAHSI